MKRVSHKTCRKVFVSLVVGASVATGTALAQGSRLPTSLPQGAEVAPAPRPETTVTPNGTALTIPLGGSQQYQMRGHKPIRSVYNQQDDVASVDPTSDRSKLLISGKKAGTSRLTLIAEDNTKEVVDVVVQPDVKYLRSLLMQAVPTANLTVIPAASGTIILGGTVTQ
ncbi:MAG TPA: pilus assembly protein N-terminal domain-containing protein, partial [Gemmataceae bacterium]|nr:pilus assembly protein N-terminal domain-containing protein [Gemmataceae bacterium]